MKAKTPRVRTMKARPIRSSTAKSGTGRASRAKASAAKAGTAKASTTRAGTTKVSTAKARTIKEIAAACGVSVATISRTLQRPGVVSEATRQRIQEVIKRLGYTPNTLARNLRTARTQLVIALVPDIANPFFSEVIRGIEHVAHEAGYSILLGETQSSLVREQTYADMIAARRADGLITMTYRIPSITIPGRLPVINACEYVKDPGISSVYVDNAAAAETAVNYLITLGHKRIAFVSGPPNSPICADRENGYRLALQKARLRIEPSLCAVGDFSIESGERAVELLLSQGQAFSAVFCSNDEMAIGTIRALTSRGLRVPQDVSVIGFDDIRFARYTTPPLTTVAQPKQEIGREAMNMMIELLSDPGVPARKRMLSADLVVRGSTAARATGR